jgi:hypothetical protein
VPRRHQKEPVLRVDVRRFVWRNAEEQWIEFIDVVDEAAPLHVGLVRLLARVAEILAPIPPVGRHLADAVLSRDQISPILAIVGGARKPARHSDDRNIQSIRLGQCFCPHEKSDLGVVEEPF